MVKRIEYSLENKDNKEHSTDWVIVYIHPLPQQPHQGIFSERFLPCFVFTRLDVDCWLIFPMDSRDEFILLKIDEAVDPPILFLPCDRMLLQN